MSEELLNRVQEALEEGLKAIENASDASEVEKARTGALGRKARVIVLSREIKSLSPEDKPAFGAAINDARSKLEAALEGRLKSMRADELRAKAEKGVELDVTLPPVQERPIGSIHPITRAMEEMKDIFKGMGFSVADGPEIELDYYNFEALNFPAEHPARDMQDTLFISDKVLLRTHTSPVQIRAMRRMKPPLKIISPGRVYRHDDDPSHSPMFHQIEGFMVDKGITFANLKGTLTSFVKRYFSDNVEIRFRPSFFPFTEPSAEVDFTCVICDGGSAEGHCSVCKGTGWLEVIGCGMIHPNVLRNVDIDPEIYSGFAFGMGVDRMLMLKYGIDNIKTLFENDLRFLKQFPAGL